MKVLLTPRQQKLELALRHSLRSRLKKYKPGHFAALANSLRDKICVSSVLICG
jgi:hypothetical protein